MLLNGKMRLVFRILLMVNFRVAAEPVAQARLSPFLISPPLAGVRGMVSSTMLMLRPRERHSDRDAEFAGDEHSSRRGPC